MTVFIGTGNSIPRAKWYEIAFFFFFDFSFLFQNWVTTNKAGCLSENYCTYDFSIYSKSQCTKRGGRCAYCIDDVICYDVSFTLFSRYM